MKNASLILAAFFLFSIQATAQKESTAAPAPETVTAELTTASFTVYGNCGMCKRTIEKAAKSVDGVQSAVWDDEAVKVTVQFDASKVQVDAIKKAIAAKGYDTDTFRATAEAYNALPGCCQYDRPAN